MDGEGDRCGDGGEVAGRLQPDVQLRRPHPVDEHRDLRDPGRGVFRDLPRRAQHVDERAEVPYGLAADLLGGGERGPRLLRRVVQGLGRDPELDPDDGEGVPDDVVQFAGDVQAGLRDPPPCLQVPLPGDP